MKKELILAIPKGRILKDLSKILIKTNLKIEDDFFDDSSRKLLFSTNIDYLKVIKIRSFDIANFVRLGAADIAICGYDVLEEFSSNKIYPLLNLNIGKCRLSIATDDLNKKNFYNKSHVKIATKYINIATKYFSQLGIQSEAIKLNGAMELAPRLNLSDYIVDLVDSGKTLRENNLIEIEKIMDVSSYLISNINSFTVKKSQINNVMNILHDI
ncbi:ATP phosphoribosyltransferase [Rickettsiales bacterium]|nr:ATP phosphoribosyltransferase [Rickettsiales bacterium]